MHASSTLGTLSVGGDELPHQVTPGAHLLGGKVKERGERTRVGELSVRVAQLVKEVVAARLEGGGALVGGVLEELGDEVYAFRGRL